jgi:hypothetical protein
MTLIGLQDLAVEKVVFIVRIKNSTISKLGVQVSLLFKVSQHERDKELMKSFMEYLNCGYISKNST